MRTTPAPPDLNDPAALTAPVAFRRGFFAAVKAMREALKALDLKESAGKEAIRAALESLVVEKPAQEPLHRFHEKSLAHELYTLICQAPGLTARELRHSLSRQDTQPAAVYKTLYYLKTLDLICLNGRTWNPASPRA